MVLKRLQGRDFVYEAWFKGRKSLDIGCGEGEFLRNDPTRIEGLEPNADAVARCKARGYRVTLGRVPGAPFPDGSFDAIHCRNVIEHMDTNTAYALLKECERLVRPGGFVVIASEVANKRFWNTFGHVKPYNPWSIRKLTRKETCEEFEAIDQLEHYDTGLS